MENSKTALGNILDTMLAEITTITEIEKKCSDREDDEHRKQCAAKSDQDKLSHMFGKVVARVDVSQKTEKHYNKLADLFDEAYKIAFSMDNLIKDGYLNIVETMTTGIHLDKMRAKIESLKKDLAL